jgi:hypothetical protein
MNKKILATIIVILFTVLILSGCTSEGKLTGTWENEEEDLRITLRDDGTITFLFMQENYSLNGTYELTKNIIEITLVAEDSGETYSETFELYYELIDNNTLSLSEDDESVIFSRV